VEEGSVVPVLELPDVALDGLALKATTLGEAALGELIEVIADQRHAPQDVAATLATLADDLGVGNRYDSIVIDHHDEWGHRRAVLDAPTRDRLDDVARRAREQSQGALLGTLVEADFERSTARVRTPDGTAVSVSFPPELADDIDDALRQPREFTGEVSYEAATATASSIRVREVHTRYGLWDRLESADFWEHRKLAELEREGHAEPLRTIDEVRAPGPIEGEDLDAFFAAIAE